MFTTSFGFHLFSLTNLVNKPTTLLSLSSVLWVRYLFPLLVTIPKNLRVIAKKLDAVLSQLVTNSTDDFSQVSSLLHYRLTYVKHSLTDPGQLISSHRAKHGLINGLGQLSRMLFGTAMDGDVLELKHKFIILFAYASSLSKVITLTSHHIQCIEQHLLDIHSFTHRLVASFNSAMNKFNKLLVFEQALSALETSVSSLLHTNSILVQNIVDAARSRVTFTLFPVKDFLHVLALGASEYKLTPLFDHRAIHYYYPLLEYFLTSDSVVIHVPFRSGDVFEVYQVELFSFSVNGSLMTLDSSSSVVLIHQELS